MDNNNIFYDLVGNELTDGFQKPGLLARAIEEAEGDESKARALYIRYRVDELKAELHQRRKNQIKREITSLKKDYGAIPEILDEAINSTSGFDDLAFSEKVEIYRRYETPEAVYHIAYRSHYDSYDIALAKLYYDTVIERFPDSPEAQWAKQQLNNIQQMSDIEIKRFECDRKALLKEKTKK